MYGDLLDDARDDALSEGDPDAIVVYRNRRGLVYRGLAMVALAGASLLPAVITFLPAWDGASQTDPLGSLLVYGLIAGAFAVAALVFFGQAIQDRPALIVNAHGIVDRCPGPGKQGRRLIRWDEIASVRAEVRGNRSFMLESLNIEIFQTPARAAREDLTVVPSPSAPAPFTTTTRRIYQDQLGMPVIELAYAIDLYVMLARPRGWHGLRSGAGREVVEAVVVPELSEN